MQRKFRNYVLCYMIYSLARSWLKLLYNCRTGLLNNKELNSPFLQYISTASAYCWSVLMHTPVINASEQGRGLPLQ